MKTNIAKDFMQGGLNMEGYAIMKKGCKLADLITIQRAMRPDDHAVPDDGPYVETEKVAKLVSYLCSEAGEIINGAVLTADAGLTAS